jgi:phosphate uptake regulator
MPDEISNMLRKMSERSLQILDNSMLAFMQEDYYSADKVADESQSIVSLESGILDLLNKVKNYDSTVIKLILEDIRRGAEHAADIAEETLNQNVNKINDPVMMT